MKKRILLRSIALLISLSTLLAFSMLWISIDGGDAATTAPESKSQEQILDRLTSQEMKADTNNTSTLKNLGRVSFNNPIVQTSDALDQNTFYSIADSTILQGGPSFNAGSTIDMWVGYDEYLDPPGQIVRSLVQFDISNLPPNQNLTSAILRIYHVIYWDIPDYGRTITTYRILTNWSESGVTWANSPSFGEAHGSKSVISGDWDWHEFDVTNLVRGWYDGSFQNYGIMLRGPEVSGTGSGWRGFGTRESDYVPELVIQYDSNTSEPTIAGLPDQELLVNTNLDNAIDLWVYTNDSEDVDADLSFVISNSPNSGAGVSIDSNRYIDINPASGWTGVTNVEIEVTDTDVHGVIDSFQVKIFGGRNNLPIVQKNYTLAPTPLPPTPTEPPSPTPTPTQEPSNCDPSYPTVCIPPPPPDLNCDDIPYRDFTVLPPDPHNFDGDHDGIGCES